MAIALKDIAEELGISMQSVTYAINGRPGVSDATRQRILETAERLGYDAYANRGARIMAARRSGKRVAMGSIGFLYTTTANHAWLNDPYNRNLVNGVVEEAGRRQLELCLTPHRLGEVPRFVRDGSIDGIIIQDGAAVPSLAPFKLPVVKLCSFSEDIHSLVPDFEQGIYLTTKHLLDLGHRQIAYVGAYAHYRVGRTWLAGYYRALAEHGITARADWLIDAGNTSEADGESSLDSLIARGHEFTAIVCANDSLAMGVVRRARELGISIPGELSVTGFDNISTECGFYPAITTVAFSGLEIGHRAVTWICEETERLVADSAGSPRAGTEAFPVELVVRESTSVPLTQRRPIFTGIR